MIRFLYFLPPQAELDAGNKNFNTFLPPSFLSTPTGSKNAPFLPFLTILGGPEARREQKNGFSTPFPVFSRPKR